MLWELGVGIWALTRLGYLKLSPALERSRDRDDPHRVRAKRSPPHRDEPAHDGGRLDFLSRPPSFRANDDRDRIRRFDIELGKRDGSLGGARLDQHDRGTSQPLVQEQIDQRFERDGLENGWNDGPAALFGSGNRDALPSILP